MGQSKDGVGRRGLLTAAGVGGLMAAVAPTGASAKQGGAPAYLYRFDYNPRTVLDGRVRAFHCAEMAYAFDNVDRCLNATGGTAEARALSAKMADAWLAFARTGDPAIPGSPTGWRSRRRRRPTCTSMWSARCGRTRTGRSWPR